MVLNKPLIGSFNGLQKIATTFKNLCQGDLELGKSISTVSNYSEMKRVYQKLLRCESKK